MFTIVWNRIVLLSPKAFFSLFYRFKANYRYMVDMVHVDADDPVISW